MSTARPAAAVSLPLTFTVHGRAVPQGSKRHLGRGILVESSDVKPWREAITWAAREHIRPGPPHDGPIALQLTFHRARPRSHYRTGANAHLTRPSAPDWPATRPDLDKLARAVLDALTGHIWRDDAQIVHLHAAKTWTTGSARLDITITEAPP